MPGSKVDFEHKITNLNTITKKCVYHTKIFIQIFGISFFLTWDILVRLNFCDVTMHYEISIYKLYRVVSLEES